MPHRQTLGLDRSAFNFLQRIGDGHIAIRYRDTFDNVDTMDALPRRAAAHVYNRLRIKDVDRDKVSRLHYLAKDEISLTAIADEAADMSARRAFGDKNAGARTTPTIECQPYEPPPCAQIERRDSKMNQRINV